MGEYSETELLQYAENLLEQANAIIAATILKYGLVSFLSALFGLLGIQSLTKADMNIGLLTVGILLLGGIAGYYEGRRRSFMLRLEAQKILALVEIEHHTRPVPV